MLHWLWNHGGELLVFVGVGGEILEHVRAFKKRKPLTETVNKACIGIILVGLAIEMWQSTRLEKEAAQTRLEAAKANERSSELEKAAAELRRINLDLQTRIQPREITPDQKRVILQGLMGKPKGAVLLSGLQSDVEAMNYLSQLSEVLKAADYEVDENPATSVSFQGLKPYEGIVLVFKNAGQVAPHTNPLAEALIKGGVKISSVVTNASMKDNILEIWVGTKPIR